MTTFRQFAIVLAAAIAALLVTATGMALVAAVATLKVTESLFTPTEAAATTFAYTAIIGAVPLLLVGVPAYFLLMRKDQARWFYALAIGAAPGLAFLAADANLGAWAIACGLCVSGMTHLFVRFGASALAWPSRRAP